jgi:hypothetical protein
MNATACPEPSQHRNHRKVQTSTSKVIPWYWFQNRIPRGIKTSSAALDLSRGTALLLAVIKKC